MAKQVEELETERLILRGIREDDAPEIVKWRSDPEIYRYFKNPHKITLEEHLQWFHDRYLPDENRLDWMCIEKATGNKIGVFGLIIEGNEAEINYLLAPEAQHKGYASEAIECQILFIEKNNINRVIAEIHGENLPSIALAKRLGLNFLKSENHFVIFYRDLTAIL